MHPRLHELAAPPRENVRVWSAEVGAIGDAELRELEAPLHADEQRRAGLFHFARDRQNFVATRGLLRLLLSEILNTQPQNLAFEYGEHGKPRLANSHTRFSVSHSAGWAMFAVATDREIGIDLENAGRLNVDDENLPALAARIFSSAELEIWRSINGAKERHSAFLRAWTRKEAVIKATGRGMFDGMAKCEVALAPDSASPSVSVLIHSREWHLYDLPAPANFLAAFAVERAPGTA